MKTLNKYLLVVIVILASITIMAESIDGYVTGKEIPLAELISKSDLIIVCKILPQSKDEYWGNFEVEILTIIASANKKLKIKDTIELKTRKPDAYGSPEDPAVSFDPLVYKGASYLMFLRLSDISGKTEGEKIPYRFAWVMPAYCLSKIEDIPKNYMLDNRMREKSDPFILEARSLDKSFGITGANEFLNAVKEICNAIYSDKIDELKKKKDLIYTKTVDDLLKLKKESKLKAFQQVMKE